jgi:hypothetical protein
MIAKKISGKTMVYGENEGITHILRLVRRAVVISRLYGVS